MGSSIVVGVAGWSYSDWEGIVYPRTEADKLSYMARYFDLIEINTSFYAIPAASTSAKWVERVADHERLTLTTKLHQSFTHDQLYPADSEVTAFSNFLKPLTDANRLGAVLAQFPFSFRDGARSRERIERIRNDFGGTPLAVEVRNKTFGEEFFDYLVNLDICPVTIDQPDLEGFIGPIERSIDSLCYARFHGRNSARWFDHEESWERYDYCYDREELAEWTDRLINSRSSKVLAVMNNHFRGQAVVNGLQLRANLRQEAKVPQSVSEYYGRDQFAGLKLESSPQRRLPFLTDE